MSFDTVYMMQVYLIICLVFSMIAYVSMIRAGSTEQLGQRLSAAASCIMARQFVNKLHIEDYSSFEKYGIWRFCGRFRSI